jgi:enoyl-CoA hydratase
VPDLIVEKQDGITTLTMNRPERRNAFSPQMMVQLAEAWAEFRDDDDARVAILTGAGADSFCSGGDLELLIPLITGAREPQDEWDRRLAADLRQILQAILRPFELYKPVIAAVNGHAVAGGCEILQATDLRIASCRATFGLAEAKRGLVPGGGSMVRLPRQVPYCKAMEILLLGDAIPAEEAHRIGLVNELVEPEQVLPRAREIAERLARNGPLAVRKIKEVVLRTNGMPIADAFEVENECSAAVMASRDAREGPRAFREKREPVFEGR